MQNGKIRPLRQKITFTIIIIVVVSLLCVGIAALINTRNISKTLIDSNKAMGQTSRAISSSSIEELNQTRLQELADDKATLADRMFYEFRQAVEMIASAAEKLYEDRDSYPARIVPLPDASKEGSLSLQTLYAPGIDPDSEDIIREAGLVGNLQETLYTINLHNDSIASDYFATASGIMVQADFIAGQKFDADGNIMPLEAATRPWYQGAASSGEPFITSVTRDAHTPRMAIMCGVPVYHDGSLMGVAGAGMYLDSIKDLVDSVNLGEKGNICIVNKYGRILFSSFKSGILSVEENTKDLRLSSDPAMVGLAIEALNGRKGIKQLDINGKPCYVAFAPLKTVGWSVFTVLSKDEVEEPSNALQRSLDKISFDAETEAADHAGRISLFLLIVFIAALLIALAVSMLLSKRIVLPIQKLTEEVSRTDGDDLDFEWDLDTGDETQLLADSFQSLTQRIKTYVNDIQTITAEKERIGTELALATRIQADMLPNIFPAFPDRRDFDVYASMTPAKEVGGDFYDFFMIDDDHLALVMADVSGKGVPAALFMMVSMILIRNGAKSGLTPAEVLEKVNGQICANNREEMFVTVWLGMLDLKTGKMTAANAGHEYPVLRQPGGPFELIKDPHGFVIGGLKGMRYKNYELQLQPGSRLFVYTDGIPEAGGDRSELYGTDRLLGALQPLQEKSPQEILEAVGSSVQAFVGDAPQFDDLTMLCLQYNGPDF